MAADSIDDCNSALLHSHRPRQRLRPRGYRQEMEPISEVGNTSYPIIRPGCHAVVPSNGKINTARC